MSAEQRFMKLYRERAMGGGEQYEQIGQRNRQIAMDRALMLGGCRDCDEEGGVANVWTNYVKKKKGFPKKTKAKRDTIRKEYYEGPGKGDTHIRNPESGRTIKVGGDVYKDLVKRGVIHPRSKSAMVAHEKRAKSVLGKSKAKAAPASKAKKGGKTMSAAQKKWIAEIKDVQDRMGDVTYGEAMIIASQLRDQAKHGKVKKVAKAPAAAKKAKAKPKAKTTKAKKAKPKKRYY